MTILLIVTVTMSMTAQISSPQNAAADRISYENKIYTVRLGKVTDNGQGKVIVEILTVYNRYNRRGGYLFVSNKRRISC